MTKTEIMSKAVDPRKTRVAILGGGIAGVTCAEMLSKEEDIEISLFEAGRDLGGRLACRKPRAKPTIHFDHGCPLIPKARSADFHAKLNEWRQEELLLDWQTNVITVKARSRINEGEGEDRDEAEEVEIFERAVGGHKFYDKVDEIKKFQDNSTIRVDRFDSKLFDAKLEAKLNLSLVKNECGTSRRSIKAYHSFPYGNTIVQKIIDKCHNAGVVNNTTDHGSPPKLKGPKIQQIVSMRVVALYCRDEKTGGQNSEDDDYYFGSRDWSKGFGGPGRQGEGNWRIYDVNHEVPRYVGSFDWVVAGSQNVFKIAAGSSLRPASLLDTLHYSTSTRGIIKPMTRFLVDTTTSGTTVQEITEMIGGSTSSKKCDDRNLIQNSTKNLSPSNNISMTPQGNRIVREDDQINIQRNLLANPNLIDPFWINNTKNKLSAFFDRNVVEPSPMFVLMVAFESPCDVDESVGLINFLQHPVFHRIILESHKTKNYQNWLENNKESKAGTTKKQGTKQEPNYQCWSCYSTVDFGLAILSEVDAKFGPEEEKYVEEENERRGFQTPKDSPNDTPVSGYGSKNVGISGTDENGSGYNSEGNIDEGGILLKTRSHCPRYMEDTKKAQLRLAEDRMYKAFIHYLKEIGLKKDGSSQKDGEKELPPVAFIVAHRWFAASSKPPRDNNDESTVFWLGKTAEVPPASVSQTPLGRTISGALACHSQGGRSHSHEERTRAGQMNSPDSLHKTFSIQSSNSQEGHLGKTLSHFPDAKQSSEDFISNHCARSLPNDYVIEGNSTYYYLDSEIGFAACGDYFSQQAPSMLEEAWKSGFELGKALARKIGGENSVSANNFATIDEGISTSPLLQTSPPQGTSPIDDATFARTNSGAMVRTDSELANGIRLNNSQSKTRIKNDIVPLYRGIYDDPSKTHCNFWWCKADESVGMSARSLLRIVRAFMKSLGIRVHVVDITLTGRIIEVFSELQKQQGKTVKLKNKYDPYEVEFEQWKDILMRGDRQLMSKSAQRQMSFALQNSSPVNSFPCPSAITSQSASCPTTGYSVPQAWGEHTDSAQQNVVETNRQPNPDEPYIINQIRTKSSNTTNPMETTTQKKHCVVRNPTVSASRDQIERAISELRSKKMYRDFIPEYKDAVDIYNSKVMGSQVNEAIRDGNIVREVPRSLKGVEWRGHSLRKWNAKSEVTSMDIVGDFRSSEKTFVLEDDMVLRIEKITTTIGGTTTIGTTTTIGGSDDEKVEPIWGYLKFTKGDILDGAFMSKKKLIEYYKKELADAYKKDLVVALCVKSTQLKDSDLELFGTFVETYFDSIFNGPYGDKLKKIGITGKIGLNGLKKEFTKVKEAHNIVVRDVDHQVGNNTKDQEELESTTKKDLDLFGMLKKTITLSNRPKLATPSPILTKDCGIDANNSILIDYFLGQCAKDGGECKAYDWENLVENDLKNDLKKNYDLKGSLESSSSEKNPSSISSSYQPIKALIPDSTYSAIYKECFNMMKEKGQFDLKEMGSTCNVGLNAGNAEEYGSLAYVATENCIIRVVEETSGKPLKDLIWTLEEGDVFRFSRTTEGAVDDWIDLGLSREEVATRDHVNNNTSPRKGFSAHNTPKNSSSNLESLNNSMTSTPTDIETIFFLDTTREHDKILASRVEKKIAEFQAKKKNCDKKKINSDTKKIKILNYTDGMRRLMERMRDSSKHTITVTGNLIRDYLTDLFPILEVGSSARTTSTIRLPSGMDFEAGSGGTAPKMMRQFLTENHLRWDSTAEILALINALKYASKEEKNYEEKESSTNDYNKKEGTNTTVIDDPDDDPLLVSNESERLSRSIRFNLLACSLEQALTIVLQDKSKQAGKTPPVDCRLAHFYLSKEWCRQMVIELQILLQSEVQKLLTQATKELMKMTPEEQQNSIERLATLQSRQKQLIELINHFQKIFDMIVRDQDTIIKKLSSGLGGLLLADGKITKLNADEKILDGYFNIDELDLERVMRPSIEWNKIIRQLGDGMKQL